MIPLQHIAAVAQALEDIAAMLRDHGDELRRLLHEYTANGLQAVTLDPDRTTRPNQVDEHGNTWPDITDPVGEHATNPPERNWSREFEHHATRVLALRRFLHELLPDEATVDKLRKETDDSDRTDAGIHGRCEACGAEVSRRDDMTPDSKRWMHHVEGHVLCSTHKRGRNKPANKHLTIEEYIATLAWRRGAA